jgi:hypothetical protein
VQCDVGDYIKGVLFGSGGHETTGDNFITRRLMICTAHTTLFREETCGSCGGEEVCVLSLVGRAEGKRPLGRTTGRWGR